MGRDRATVKRLTSSQARPHFDVLFPISYGLSRQALEEINHRIRSGVISSRPVQPAVDDVGQVSRGKSSFVTLLTARVDS